MDPSELPPCQAWQKIFDRFHTASWPRAAAPLALRATVKREI